MPNAAMIVAAHIQTIEVFEFVVERVVGGQLYPRASLRVGPIPGWMAKRGYAT
ncbi:hypothetical protein [Candidatus Poriferisodalis sp.]|uniref:hypothetical protein n=1 Tax=Candidatus Poriferisodalis sp. TaxID=3101277 RepID=UPI003D111B16